MPKKLYEIAAGIVEAQATMGQMPPDALEQALAKVFVTLQRMKMAEDGGMLLEEAKPESPVDPGSSIHEDKVICLECRREMRQLTAKHLSAHGLTMREYKTKWGFAQKQSLSARALSRARSRAARKRGLPEQLLKFQEMKRQEKAARAEGAAGTPEAGVPVKKRAKTRASVRKKTE